MHAHLHDLLNHMAWADAVYFKAWSEGPMEDEELRERWSHVHGTAAFFLEVLNGTHDLPWDKIHSGDVRPPWLDQRMKTFDELKSHTKSVHEAFAVFMAGLDEAALDRMVRIPWFPDPPCVITVSEAITQVALHTQHHRGQCMTKLRGKGGESKDVDFIIWLWKGRPAARWD